MGDILERKTRTHFRRLDYDKDGVISRKDFQVMAEGFADKEGFNPTQKEALKHCFNNLFSSYSQAAGPDDDVLLTEESMVESIKAQKDSPVLKKRIRDLMVTAFAVLDLNQDGYLDFAEYHRIFENLGIANPDFTKAAFDAIDVNHDGKLSAEEFINATTDSICSESENTAGVFGIF